MINRLLPSAMARRRALMTGGLAAVVPFIGWPFAYAADSVSEGTPKDFALSSYDADKSLSRIQKKGELVIGTSNDFPYSYLDMSSGELKGIDAEIIKFVAKALNIGKVTVQTVPFDGLVPGVQAGRFDMVGDSIHYTPTRAKVVSFSYPTYFYAEAMIVRKGSQIKANKIAELAGKSCGTVLGTSYTDWIRETSDVTYQGYKDAESMMEDVASGRLDVGIYDRPVIVALIKNHPQWPIEFVEGYEPRTVKVPANYSCYLFRQSDQQLVEAVSRVIQWMQYAGEMKKIVEKWNLGPGAL